MKYTDAIKYLNEAKIKTVKMPDNLDELDGKIETIEETIESLDVTKYHLNTFLMDMKKAKELSTKLTKRKSIKKYYNLFDDPSAEKWEKDPVKGFNDCMWIFFYEMMDIRVKDNIYLLVKSQMKNAKNFDSNAPKKYTNYEILISNGKFLKGQPIYIDKPIFKNLKGVNLDMALGFISGYIIAKGLESKYNITNDDILKGGLNAYIPNLKKIGLQK